MKIKITYNPKKLSKILPKATKKLLSNLAEDRNEGIVKNVQLSRDVDDDFFKDLSPKYAEGKFQDVGFVEPILIKYGDMIHGITQSDNKDSSTLTSTVPSPFSYNVAHNEGIHGMPRRKWFGLPQRYTKRGEFRINMDDFLIKLRKAFHRQTPHTQGIK